ncbi:MAG: hypothetical protein QRY71_01140 [Candidatus Rhabdochlamydia sp.]
MKTSMLSLLGAFIALIPPSLYAREPFSCYVEAAYFGRIQSHNTPFIIDNSLSTGVKTVLGDFHHHFKFEPGFKTALQYRLDETEIELSYLWIHPETSYYSRSDTGSLSFAYLPPNVMNTGTDFENANAASAVYHSVFWQGELSLTRFITPPGKNYFSCAYRGSVKYLSLQENMVLSYTADKVPSPYTVKSYNTIPAIQLGGVMHVHPMRHLTWSILAQGGVGVNTISQKMLWRDLNDTVTVGQNQEKKFSFPFVADMALRLCYNLSSNMELTASYQATGIYGIALSSQQFIPNWETGLPSRKGYVIFHGVTSGLGLKF